jgi:transposase
VAARQHELDLSEIDKILDELKTIVAPAKLQKLELLLERYRKVVQILKNKKSVIRKLERLLFGPRSEKTRDVLNRSTEQKPKGSGEANGQSKGKRSSDQSSTNDGDGGQDQDSDKSKRRGGKPKGSGRLGASDYPGATEIPVDHGQLNCGDACPDCNKGKLGELKRRAPSLFFYAQAPIAALLFMLQILRCSCCGREFRASAPGPAATCKHDPSTAAMIALFRYLLGFPHTRLEKIQEIFGIPLPKSTQWDILRVYKTQLRILFDHLVNEAAQGDLMHCDDTVMRVLDLVKEIRIEKANDPKARTGIFTTNIVSRMEGRKIVLFLTGRRHAGENMERILSLRDARLEDVLQMCDGLDRNCPENIAVVLCNCLVHGRRQFVDIIVDFPEQVQRVLQDIKKVYKHEETAQKEGMTPEQRLSYHQEHSKPILDDLKLWFEQLQQQKLVEPNSGLGKAINYMLSRWDKLTRFLQVAGAPIDNNISERALKMAIVHRKNSQYYRSVVGAQLGDCIMSLGNTCLLNGINPYDYLVALFTHIDTAASEPQLWMPWNFEKRRRELDGQSQQSVSEWATTLTARGAATEPAANASSTSARQKETPPDACTATAHNADTPSSSATTRHPDIPIAEQRGPANAAQGDDNKSQASETTSGQKARQPAPHQAADSCASTTPNSELMQSHMAPPSIYGVDSPKSAAGDRIDNQQPAVGSKRPDRWSPQVQNIQQDAMGTDERGPPPCQFSVPLTGARLPEPLTPRPGP